MKDNASFILFPDGEKTVRSIEKNHAHDFFQCIGRNKKGTTDFESASLYYIVQRIIPIRLSKVALN